MARDHECCWRDGSKPPSIEPGEKRSRRVPITIEGLTKVEAKVLVAILRRVGGQTTGPRRVADRLLSALKCAEIETGAVDYQLVDSSDSVFLKPGPSWDEEYEE